MLLPVTADAIGVLPLIPRVAGRGGGGDSKSYTERISSFAFKIIGCIFNKLSILGRI